MSEIVVNIIAKFGSQTALASAIEAKQSTVAHWKRRGTIPAGQQIKILNAARGLNIDLTPNDFFPQEKA